MKIQVLLISFLVMIFSTNIVSAADLCCKNADGCGKVDAQLCPIGFQPISCATCPSVTAPNPSTTPAQTPAATTPAGSNTTTFVNPLGDVNTVAGVLSNVLNNLKGIIASISIVFIVVGGFMYILSAGNEKMITQAKATITSAMIGLAIALAAPTFLKEITTILGTGGGGGSASDAVNQALTLKQIVMRVLNLLLSIVGIVAMIGLVIGGASYLTAYGDEKKIESGKKIITNSIIGIAVALLALVVVKQISTLLGVQ